MPLIEVEALAARDAVPYAGPDRRSSRKTKVSVVVPAMNEEQNIGHVLKRAARGPARGDPRRRQLRGRHDRGRPRAPTPSIRVLVQSGRGKGDAFRTGFAAVTGNLVVMLDADGSADPAEIPRFVEALEAGADFAKGSRFLPAAAAPTSPAPRSLGNAFLSGTANLLHGTHFTDLCYGYNAFWARCLPFISLDVPGFEVETLINLRIAGAGMKITEVPSYEARPHLRREQPQHLPRRLPRARHDPQRGAPPPQHPPRAPGDPAERRGTSRPHGLSRRAAAVESPGVAHRHGVDPGSADRSRAIASGLATSPIVLAAGVGLLVCSIANALARATLATRRR